MGLLGTYLLALREIRGLGTDETSGYGALEGLINTQGKELKPRVRCILHPKNRGAGLPDGGLFSADQFHRNEGEEARKSKMLAGQLPSRGVVEAKGLVKEVDEIASKEQVVRYLDTYGQVLVTNYRDFLLVGRDRITGGPRPRDRYQLAANEAAFWSLAASAEEAEAIHGERLHEFLRRVLLSGAPLTSPKDLADFLASYARDALARVARSDLSALAQVRQALEEALGISFQGKRGDHFFKSSLIQTLFYGIFSAWVLWSRKHPPGDDTARFDWRTATWELHVPMIRALFEQVALPSRLGPLGLVNILDLTGDTLNRVERAAFFSRFEADAAVQYFYEPFLEAFDPQLRKELGVWYTPPEIVRYQVDRVDRVLRDEIGIQDGLADDRVYVLDPCCGTGAYLVEVIRRIHQTKQSRGGADALGGSDLKRAATTRIFGFEILPAPFVVAHLQLGLLLSTLGAPLSEEKAERAGVYLTNSLTGWKPTEEPQGRLALPELEAEREAAEQVKREKPILVVLGNPPYYAFAGVAPAEEQGIVDVYKTGLISEWGIRKFNLDELYIRFFRLAERRIVERTDPGEGVICFISSYSYLGDPSFVLVRKRLLSGFDLLWFDSLNGDSRETGKKTPDGKPDPSVFSTKYNREGIQLGTAISLIVRKKQRNALPVVRYRDLWGVSKRADLVGSLNSEDFNAQYASVSPTAENRYSFRPAAVAAAYLTWPKVVELCSETPISGLQEMRKGALMDIDRDSLENRMRRYHDSDLSWADFRTSGSPLAEDAPAFSAERVRSRAVATASFNASYLVRYSLYPLDTRWAYYSTVPSLWNRPRPNLFAQLWPGNQFFVARMMAERPGEQVAMFCTRTLPDYHLLRPNVVAIPIRLREQPKVAPDGATGDLFHVTAPGGALGPVANLSAAARQYLQAIGIKDPDADADTAALVWMHALAIGFSPQYLVENEAGILTDYPRVPLPATREALESSAALGCRVAELVDTESPPPAPATDTYSSGFAGIGAIARADGLGTELNPDEGELALTAGWGVPTRDRVMPSRGVVQQRDYTPQERAGLVEAWGDDALLLLGEQTCDVYLNRAACWRNIPTAVWEYRIGGYQVLKKWLSYRDRKVLGRDLTVAEAREVTGIARRIAALLLLGPALDANYTSAKKSAYAWPQSSVG